MTEQPVRATVTVLTFNSAKTLERCLSSVRSFDEILILDGGSADETLEIARKFGARIERQSEVSGPISDFTAVRERSFSLSKHDWILWLDSDEWIDETLVASVRHAVATEDVRSAFTVERVPIVNGHEIHHAYFTPDVALRFVNRQTAHWARGKKVHEHLATEADVIVRRLAGTILTPWQDLATYAKKDRYYLSLAFGRRLEKRPPFVRTVRAILKNTAYSLAILCKSGYLSLRYRGTQSTLPWGYSARFARYHWRVAMERCRQFVYGSRYVPPSA